MGETFVAQYGTHCPQNNMNLCNNEKWMERMQRGSDTKPWQIFWYLLYQVWFLCWDSDYFWDSVMEIIPAPFFKILDLWWRDRLAKVLWKTWSQCVRLPLRVFYCEIWLDGIKIRINKLHSWHKRQQYLKKILRKQLKQIFRFSEILSLYQ